MSTIVKLVVATIVALVLSSCNFNINFGEGVQGNGNVMSQKRELHQSFDAIKVSTGMELYITQGPSEHLEVKADENLHDIINTEVTDGVLNIWSEKNIKSAVSKRVLVTIPNITQLQTSSGAYAHSEAVLKAKNLELISSSGSHIDIIVDATAISCKTSSGSGVTISGEADKLNAKSSSGSYIKASNLVVKVAHTKASSGSNIHVNASEEVLADTSSGANIRYSGNPESVSKNKPLWTKAP